MDAMASSPIHPIHPASLGYIVISWKPEKHGKA